jgi:hypothetical protein
MSTETFYLDLPVIDNFIDVSKPEIYTGLPDDWQVVVTDVKDSTKAIEKGRYKEVNLLGASSIIAMLNLMKSFSLPFVFGGRRRHNLPASFSCRTGQTVTRGNETNGD